MTLPSLMQPRAAMRATFVFPDPAGPYTLVTVFFSRPPSSILSSGVFVGSFSMRLLEPAKVKAFGETTRKEVVWPIPQSFSILETLFSPTTGTSIHLKYIGNFQNSLLFHMMIWRRDGTQPMINSLEGI